MVENVNGPAGDFLRELAAAVRRFRDEAEAAKASARREAEEARRCMRAEAEELRDRAKRWNDFRGCDSEGIRLDASKVGEAFREAAIAGIRAFLDGLEDGLRRARDEAGVQAGPEPQPRPKPAKARAKKASAKPKPRRPRS